MSNAEEQQQEVEILESIYPDELEKLSETKFNIHLTLETEPRQFLVLEVEYPEDYPEVVPNLDVDTTDGSYLNIEEEDEQEESNESIEGFTKQDMKELVDVLNENALENVGMPSIFTIASLLKETAEEKYAAKLAFKEKQREKEILEQEEKENAKFRGTPVTPESFAEWRKKFRQEFKLDEQNEIKDKTKLTGKEIFERGLYKDEEEEEELAADTAQLSVLLGVLRLLK